MEEGGADMINLGKAIGNTEHSSGCYGINLKEILKY